MFGLIKSATRKTAIKTLTSATEDALESLFSNMEGTDALLSRLGVDRQQALDAVVSVTRWLPVWRICIPPCRTRRGAFMART